MTFSIALFLARVVSSTEFAIALACCFALSSFFIARALLRARTSATFLIGAEARSMKRARMASTFAWGGGWVSGWKGEKERERERKREREMI